VVRHAVHYSGNTDLWSTPQRVFDQLDAEFHFSTDVCALPENAKCKRFYSPEEDGLSRHWTGVCWMNPPFGGRGKIDPWIKKAYESACSGNATIVCLVPARTGSPWFWEYCSKGEIRFIKSKLYFSGQGAAPFNSAIVIFHAHLDPGGIVKWITNFRGSAKNYPAPPGVERARAGEHCLAKSGVGVSEETDTV
jgi:phage N-6-adenine-methyltransferase